MIAVVQGDLVDVAAGAVMRPVAADFSAVTAAMRRLDLAAGPAVAAQCGQIGELPLGSAVVTAAGELPVQFLVHVAVRSQEELVTGATVRRGILNGLRRLTEWEIESVAMPLLGTGAGNLDAEEAAQILVSVLADHLARNAFPKRVMIVVENEYERTAAERALAGSALRTGTESDA
ncbi:MAG TPA: macro domain-containing protein [Longimicrobiales bacterium]|nr:macro domain-containing protein [Longimicrobiales bacterium]